jgi:hypothetical protein
MFHFNLGFNIPLLIVAVCLTILSAFIASMITGERMPWKGIWNSALFCAFIPIIYHIIIGGAWLWMVIIITNILLFFILPLWWEPMEKEKKIYSYIIFLIFNTVLILAGNWLLEMIIKGGA